MTCPYYKKCGACNYLDLDYEEQLKKKYSYVNKLLKPFGKVEAVVGMHYPYYYRNKVHAVFDRDRRGNIIAGIYEEESHKVVNVEECLLEDKRASAIIKTIRDMLKSFKITVYNEKSGYGLLRHVLIRTGHVSGQILVTLVLTSPILPSKNNFVKALLKVHPDITSVVININDKKTTMVLGERNILLYGKGYIEDTLCGKTFRISPNSFYQINSAQTEKLYAKAIEYAALTGKETVLDAYCGIGTIGMVAADKAKRVIGVELNKAAVADAKVNAKLNKCNNIQFYQGDAGKFIEEMAERGEKLDVVMMDPPRSGSSKEFLDAIIKMKPSKVVYISCNPETLAEDLRYITKNGYRMEIATPYDLFCHTRHVEVVCSLNRGN
ncbi:MAG: 23S rRNA (uracil(1939)-C(5))-methyltransferase RlmD [Lachnospiraceae bacterium]|nr:23S rRNA (uracil(1939)-C(5))-methyltransferase RlmD [Lachnospiraceae bacterium]